jgi:hypothetical protein
MWNESNKKYIFFNSNNSNLLNSRKKFFVDNSEEISLNRYILIRVFISDIY